MEHAVLWELSFIRQFVFICNCLHACGYRQEWIKCFGILIGTWQSSHCRLPYCQACSGCRHKKGSHIWTISSFVIQLRSREWQVLDGQLWLVLIKLIRHQIQKFDQASSSKRPSYNKFELLQLLKVVSNDYRTNE